jgi:DNA-binding transcriptional regulator PaaX
MSEIKTPRWYSSICFKDTIILGLLLLIDINIHGRDFCRGNRKPIYNYPFELFNEYLEKIKNRKASEISSFYRLKKENVFNVTNNNKINLNLDTKWWWNLFNLKFRFFIAPKKWDGNWTIVTYDVPENQKSARRNIKNLLEKLGFVQMHRSVWITINDVEEYLQNLFSEFYPNVFCFRSTSLFKEKDQEVIKSLFRPHEVENRYNNYISSIKSALKTRNQASITKLLNDFPDLILADRGLPAEFFDDKFIRSNLWKEAKKIQASIL